MKETKEIAAVKLRPGHNLDYGHNFTLEAAGKLLRVEVDAHTTAQAEARMRALRIGALLMYGRSQAEHGDFMPWVKEHVPEFSHSHCGRFLRLAESFVAKNKIEMPAALALCDSSSAPSAKSAVKKMEQLALDFFGDCESLSDLLDREGIKTKAAKPAPKKTGGVVNPLFAEFMRECHPDATAKTLADVPMFRGEFERWQKQRLANQEAKPELQATTAAECFFANADRLLAKHKSGAALWTFLDAKHRKALADMAGHLARIVK